MKTISTVIPKPCNCKSGKWQYIQTPGNFFEALICKDHGYIIKTRAILLNTLSLTKRA